jgi:hypothetical protein
MYTAVVYGRANQTFTGSAAAPKQNTDQKRNRNCVQGCFLSPTSQAVERRTWLPACFNGVGNRLSGFLDRLRSRLNGLRGLLEFVWIFDTFADHLNSPRYVEDRRPERTIVPAFLELASGSVARRR